jgi:predicted molibdopterin-dependent oxidoreductase YjgC
MLKLRINGKDIEAVEGATVLAVCRKEAIEVPTMCYLDGHIHFTSCMLCVVKDLKTGRLIPACSAPVTDGMELETKSEEVVDARRVALELLLSEHVGDCEGPCERVCPAQIRIPVALRLLAEGKRQEAGEVVVGTQTKAGLFCRECNGRCEKPCRRGQVDESVSIRELMLYAADGLPEKLEDQPRPKRFNSVIGRLTDEEKADLLAHAQSGARVAMADREEELTAEEAAREAKRCLHCDCRKPSSCRLRKYSEQYAARQSRYKGSERKPLEIVRQHEQVVYEPGKCIKCGICVKITEGSSEPLGLAFLNRGYDSVVGVPFSEPLSKGLTTTAEECVRCCPTGALAHVNSEEA